MIEWLFRIIETPLLWLSHRAKRTAQAPRETGLGSLGDGIDSSGPLTLAASDLARHTYILGSTGCGKTTLILKLIEQDLRLNHTIAVVDLRGDLIRGVLGLCDRLEIEPDRLTLLDLREKQRIQGFNPLLGAGETYVRALHLLDVVRAESESWGVQLEETLRSALLVLAECRAPLTKLEPLFYDAAFRTSCLLKVRDESLLGFWNRYDNLSKERQQSWALPVLNKVTALLAVPTLRNILGSAESLSLQEILGSKGHVLLVSLAVDELHRSSRMLGSLLLSAISREMMARVNVPEPRRNPVRLYVDEFENIASESFEGLIAEGRRFGLSLVLSHQTLSQLPARLRSVVRNNVGLQILFQTGFEDARLLANELPDEIELEELRALEVGQAVVMSRDGIARIVQFHAPGKQRSARTIDAFRERVLAELPRAPQPVPQEISSFDGSRSSEPDLEDWL